MATARQQLFPNAYVLPYAALPLRADWWANSLNNPLYVAEHMPAAAPGYGWHQLIENERWHEREPTLLELNRDRNAPRQWVQSADTVYLLLKPDEWRQLSDTQRHVRELAQIEVQHPPAPADDASDAEWQRYITETEDSRNRSLALNELRWKLARAYQILIQSFTNKTAARLGKPPVYPPGAVTTVVNSS